MMCYGDHLFDLQLADNVGATRTCSAAENQPVATVEKRAHDFITIDLCQVRESLRLLNFLYFGPLKPGVDLIQCNQF